MSRAPPSNEDVDPVGAGAQFERPRRRRAARRARPALSTQIRSMAPRRFALEIEEEVEALFDVRPVEARRPGSARESAKRAARDGQQPLARLGRKGAGRIGLDKRLRARVPAMPVSRGPVVALDRLERLQAENTFGVDRVRIAAQGLDPGDAERASAAVRPADAAPAFAAAGARPAGRARAHSRDSARRAPAAAAWPRRRPRAAMRCRKREATVGSPPRFFARLRIASGAPSAATKSCAVWPMRRSGGERPSSARIGRLRKASVLTAGGQTVSSRPARSTRSKLEQTRFEKAKDREPRMAAAGRRRARRRKRIVEQRRVVDERGREVRRPPPRSIRP